VVGIACDRLRPTRSKLLNLRRTEELHHNARGANEYVYHIADIPSICAYLACANGILKRVGRSGHYVSGSICVTRWFRTNPLRHANGFGSNVPKWFSAKSDLASGSNKRRRRLAHAVRIRVLRSWVRGSGTSRRIAIPLVKKGVTTLFGLHNYSSLIDGPPKATTAEAHVCQIGAFS